MAKILLIEDDKLTGENVSDVLTAKGHVVDVARSGAEAKAYFKVARYDLAIVDWSLPDTTGPEVCRYIRSSENANVSVLFLTAQSEITNKEEGFESGADDYLTKPFHMNELVARVKALLKRPAAVKPRRLQVRDLVLDLDKREAYKNGEAIHLLPKEFALLEFLMNHPRQVFTVEALLEHVWPTQDDSSPETVRTTMMRMRQRLGFPKDQPLIVTDRGFGYRLEP